ncbi:MAG: metallophosphoesterase family protein, partial [Polaromonas sp.]|nr:metallophosphoesterase family protein [Polaromonas sp.]
MRLHILSDLHLELASFEPDAAAVEQADLVVLAGDIHKGVNGISWARRTFPDKPVIYVAGNHEFYEQYWPLLADKLRKEYWRHDAYSGVTDHLIRKCLTTCLRT